MNPATEQVTPPMLDQVGSAVEASARAVPELAALTDDERLDLLDVVATALDDQMVHLVELAGQETALEQGRLESEFRRMTDQLRMLGEAAASGPQCTRPSLSVDVGVRRITVPVGPVAVFAASNFPFAFGVCGGDTGSALAAGCPVVVKAHPAQPRLSRALVEVLRAAVRPLGAVGFVEGESHEISTALVAHPAIRAVGFTGSLAGGRALLRAAAARPDPIPVYAEMGSLNPVFVLPEASRDVAMADWIADSVLGSAGQLCTKPGLVLIPDSAADLIAAVCDRFEQAGSATMLTPGMSDAFQRWHREMKASDGVDVYGAAQPPATSRPMRQVAPFVACTRVQDLTAPMLKEHFGPTTILAAGTSEEILNVANRLEGSLAASVIAAPSDEPLAQVLVPRLVPLVGRLVWNAMPTGVAVCDAMVHGGPWPATSDPRTTSVGSAAIDRFRRPVAIQGPTPSWLDAPLAPFS